MDLSVYTKAIAGVPLLFVVFGAVEIMKRLKNREGGQLISGNVLLLASLAWGLLVGAGYMLAEVPPPAVFVWSYWFGLACYGLGLGYLASLFFDMVSAVVEKAIAKLAGTLKVDPPQSIVDRIPEIK